MMWTREKYTFPTPWRKFFCLVPREVEGRMVWVQFVHVREVSAHMSYDGLVYHQEFKLIGGK